MKLKIAEHILSLTLSDRHPIALDAYKPFVCNNGTEELYRVEEVERLDYTITQTLLEDVDLSDDGMVRVNIYTTSEGTLYNIIMPQSHDVDAQLHIVGDVASVWFANDRQPQTLNAAFTNAMILSYINYTLPHNTLLLHASAIVKDGQAHLFIGKSGTGKSTHTRMWQEAFPDAELLNDDHPVVRRHTNGDVIAYGSPWSGKTPCYRNDSAPLRSIARIKRADHNRLKRLRPILGYASVMTSCSGMQWDLRLAEAKVTSLESIITQVGCYDMECLPNNAAAVCCHESLCAEK